MDPASGLYTQFGLNQVAEQVEARALRNHEAVACVAFSSQPTGLEPGQGRRGEDMDSSPTSCISCASRRENRMWVAKTGDSQLAILAPDTDAAGARLLVARLQREIDMASKRTTPPGLVPLAGGLLRGVGSLCRKHRYNRDGSPRQKRSRACSDERTRRSGVEFR